MEPSKIRGIEVVEQNTKTRNYLAFVVTLSYISLVFIASMSWIFGLTPKDEAIDFITTVSSVLAGIVGLVLGFYFKEQSSQSK